MKKDSLDILFSTIKEDLDINTLPEGHQQRFLDKLNAEQPKQKRLGFLLRIASVIVVVLALGSFLVVKQANIKKTGLATVSPKMAETESFFIATINNELKKLKNQENAQTKEIVEDALLQIKQLEKDYSLLESDLLQSNNDKRIVFALISNLQNRIDLLQEVLQTLSDIKTINKQSYENI